jgi:alkyl hydroperoxide reductase subunit AhpF
LAYLPRYALYGREDDQPHSPAQTPEAGTKWAKADVIIYGATPAGVIAAISAANLGASVFLIGGWRATQLGGMLAGGLSWTDVRDIDATGGYDPDLSKSALNRVTLVQLAVLLSTRLTPQSCRNHVIPHQRQRLHIE